MTNKNNSASLSKLISMDHEMREFGFSWKHYDQIITQILNETAEIKEALDAKESHVRVQEEIGDLLHATISLALFTKCDVEKMIETSSKKLTHRFKLMQKIALTHGYANLKDQPTEVLLTFWNEAKKESSL